MVEKQLQFEIPRKMELADIIQKLQKSLAVREDGKIALARTYYDSFDWRLYKQGSLLEIEFDGRQSVLKWTDRDNSTLLASLEIVRPPRFAWDFPEKYWRERLEGILDVRAILPQAEIQGLRRCLNVLNEDEKTVVRLYAEENSICLPDSHKAKSLGTRVWLQPVKGYQDYFDQVSQILEKDLKLPAAREPLFSWALSALGRQPLDYSSKLDFQLDPHMRTDAATKIILRHLLAILRANEKGVRENLDAEFLHDFRVAVRRTRSALSQIKKTFPQETVDYFALQFAWLGQITGPTRDLDVYRLNFSQYKASLPEPLQEALDPLLDFLHQKHAQAHQELVDALHSNQYAGLIQDWHAFLEAPLPDKSALPYAMLPIHKVANKRIFRLYRRILKEGRAIQPETPAHYLHELRKSCKKLRYMMEFFQSLYPAKKTKPLIKNLKTLQDNLGTFQDLEVQRQALKGFGEEMKQSAQLSAKTLSAMDALVQSLDERQRKTRAEFAERFAQFESPEHRAEFEDLFKPE